MRDLFVKSLKWYVISLLIIIGFALVLLASREATIKPMMPAVLSFGFAFILTTFWHKLNRELMLVSIGVYIASAYVAQFVPTAIYILFGFRFDFAFSLSWAFTALVMGMPVMMWAFKKFD